MGGISFSDDGVGERVNCYEERHLDAMKQEFFWEGGGVLPYISHIGVCCPRGYGFGTFLF